MLCKVSMASLPGALGTAARHASRWIRRFDGVTGNVCTQVAPEHPWSMICPASSRSACVTMPKLCPAGALSAPYVWPGIYLMRGCKERKEAARTGYKRATGDGGRHGQRGLLHRVTRAREVQRGGVCTGSTPVHGPNTFSSRIHSAHSHQPDSSSPSSFATPLRAASCLAHGCGLISISHPPSVDDDFDDPGDVPAIGA